MELKILAWCFFMFFLSKILQKKDIRIHQAKCSGQVLESVNPKKQKKHLMCRPKPIGWLWKRLPKCYVL